MDFEKEMRGFYMHSVTLPENVTAYFTGLIGKFLEFIGRSGGSWHVELICSGDKLVLQSGWSNFASANNVSQNDLLRFKFIGESRFEVQVFDEMGLEKNTDPMQLVSRIKTSSFKLDYKHVEGSHQIQFHTTKLSHASHNIATEEQTYNGSAEMGITKTPPLMSKYLPLNHGEGDLYEEIKKKKVIKQYLFCQNDGAGRKTMNGCIPVKEVHFKSDFRHASKISPTDERSKNPGLCLSVGDKSCYMPLNRVMSAEEKQRFHQLTGEAKLGNPSFLKILTKSSLGIGGLKLSRPFCDDHLPRETQTAVLCWPNKENTWLVRYYYRRSNQSFECNPWVKFVQENKLKEGDMCLFELVKAAEQITFIVHVSPAT